MDTMGETTENDLSTRGRVNCRCDGKRPVVPPLGRRWRICGLIFRVFHVLVYLCLLSRQLPLTYKSLKVLFIREIEKGPPSLGGWFRSFSVGGGES